MISPLLQVNYRTERRTSYSRYTLTTVRTSHHPVVLTWLRPKSRGSSTYRQNGWINGIDRTMRMAAQVEQVIHQSRAARSMLRPVLRSHLPLRAKLALYKGYIRSRLTYAAPAWYALCSTSQRKRI
ncbi:hypothetical protein EVAR_93166_1 [Eumeta japonica]|uniref:Uncharacterized protein n=1 Tax=Eumeta variegata TaxID=151549 RepID=A0A4C1TG74_EUMVA|nr:hypothetical protein EVAR_93166_1 [Eumeta japonica]